MRRPSCKNKQISTSTTLQLSSQNAGLAAVADQPPQVHVTSIMKRLKYLMRNHKDVLKLESVKAVISALEDSKTVRPKESQLEFPNNVHYASSPISAAHKSFRRKQAYCDNPNESDIRIGAAYGSSSSAKYSSSRSKASVSGRSCNAPVDTAISVKKASVTLNNKFENVYKRVTRHYFFMLKPIRPTRSNLLSVFLSFLAFIFYFQLHTTTGFSRLWLKWENVDLSSVECTIQTPNLAMELFRPPVSCSMCHNISSVHRVSGISPSVFEKVSNCDAEISHILRQYYEIPYFLPETAESTHADWIFMGTPGFGAQMHIDLVLNPSWQGQIRGHKRWHLQPPPECYYECQSLYTDVHPGEIFVLDTNKWYHQTQILPGENSVTIGSEYD
ncbi:unnamed protein product [Orchesella dallaii]|uniref:JmjC domain-containing protein n=1 Tax=Orchesella dallaii TaxID=48710 RepID=A0ABP1PNG7_9HEXA